MGKFGIGARVRHEIGTGIVIEKTKGYRRVRFDARRDYELWVKKENLEPETSEPSSDCSPAETVNEIKESVDALSRQHKFEVGDVVEVVDTSGWCHPGQYKLGERCIVSAIDGNLVECVGKDAGMYSWRFKPAGPITVTAGGYYKTRSGEVVGPMMRSSIVEFPFTAVLYPNLESWRKDGTWSLFPGIPSDLDLISAVSAPEPKHKVGDRVVVLDNHTLSGDELKVDVGSVHTILVWGGFGGSWVLSGLPGNFLWDSQLAAAPLKEGDTVSLTSLVGTISRTGEHDDKVRVDLGDGDFAWVSPNKLAA